MATEWKGWRGLTVVVGATLLLAGCLGAPASDGTATDGTTASSVETTATPTPTPTPADESASGAATGYQWTENESYTYEDRGGNTFRFRVVSVADGEVTVEFTANRSGQVSTETITGEQGRFFRSLDEGDRSKLGFFAFVPDGRLAAAGQELTVGNTWTGSSDGEEYTAEVTGTDTVLGQECYTLVIESDSGTLEPCVRTDFPMALAATGTGSQGLSIQFTMTDYNRP